MLQAGGVHDIRGQVGGDGTLGKLSLPVREIINRQRYVGVLGNILVAGTVYNEVLQLAIGNIAEDLGLTRQGADRGSQGIGGHARNRRGTRELLDGQSGCFFSSFRPHVRATLLDGLIGLPAPSRLDSGIPRLPALHFVPFRAALR